MKKIDLFDGGYLYFDKGKFDDWCVYEIDENGIKKVPKDIDCFNELESLSKLFEPDILYDDFVKIYDMTKSDLEEITVETIENIVKFYDEYSNDLFRIFSTIYMGMIAEQNKKNTKLGKRIKRLGIYNLLIKKYDPVFCANFMRGKDWIEIDRLCIEGGF